MYLKQQKGSILHTARQLNVPFQHQPVKGGKPYILSRQNYYPGRFAPISQIHQKFVEHHSLKVFLQKRSLEVPCVPRQEKKCEKTQIKYQE